MTAKSKKPAARKPAARKPAAPKPAARKPAAPKSDREQTPYAKAVARFLAPVTEAALLEEAAALDPSLPRIAISRGDLVADAKELQGASSDLEELMRRKYVINAHTLHRLELLTGLLTPYVVEGDLALSEAEARTASTDVARVRLLAIRTQLAMIAASGGLPAEWFKLSLRKTDRINPVVQRPREILLLANKKKDDLPDPERVAALIAEGRRLVDAHLELRAERSELRGKGGAASGLVEQLTRLLWDVMLHMSTVGLAAFPEDPSREARYRLDHVYAAKAGDNDT